MSAMGKRNKAPMPRLASAKAVGKLCVEVKWKAGPRKGRTEIIDLAPIINAFKVYKPLRASAAAFRMVELIDDGEAIAWMNGDIDMAATSIERLAEEAMTGSDFKAFLHHHRLTYDAAAALLGRSRRQIAYDVASRMIPRYLALACFGFDARTNADCEDARINAAA
jgi:hypothetical protein